jgi:outer membrane protein OmpA-like peptidoglycan-associated protein
MFSRMAGFYISEHTEEEFASEEFVDEHGRDVTVEGKLTVIRYELMEGQSPRSNLAILRNFIQAVQSIGGNAYEYSGNSAYLNVRKDGRETWLNVYAGGGEYYILTIIEKGEVQQEVTSSWLLDELNRSGRVALYINFAFGEATILPESRPVLDEVLSLLLENPDLKLRVEGHTDDVGSDQANQELSEGRARAVVEALTARGVASSRLASGGYGESRPMADNATEEGRARNRRVELVRM